MFRHLTRLIAKRRNIGKVLPLKKIRSVSQSPKVYGSTIGHQYHVAEYIEYRHTRLMNCAEDHSASRGD